MGTRAFTTELYSALEAHFRKHPGDHLGAAKAAGCDRRTAQRAWEGPRWHHYPWAIPVKEKVLAEEQERQRLKAEEDQRRTAALIEKQEKARAEAEELAKIDEQTMKLARVATHRGLAQLVGIGDGIAMLARRLNEQLSRGTDANGQPLNIDASEALKVMSSYARSTKALVDATNTLVSIERVKEGLPTAIVGIDVAHVTLEEAEAELERATESIQKARELGLITH